MSNLIQLLPDHVANQIAAGEVVQRPASVIKELVENAIDSGATDIKVIVKNAGKSLIQVIDNGCGMNEIDARMSFERHATSKIRSAEDLFKIFTKGFRGEALASIAAVAQVEIKTRPHESELGTAIINEGSVIKSQIQLSCPAGTSIAVKNLFFNIPARRGFLKSDAAELKHIIEEFLRVALVHPAVGLRLNHNDQDIFILQSGNLRQRIVAAFGKSYNERIAPVEENTTVADIIGFVGKPEFARKTRGEQYIFVNDRFIKSSYLHHAIASSYDDLIEKGAHPTYFLYLKVDPATIDINIHPTKTEVKFLDDKSLYSIIHASVKQSLGMFNIKPSLDFDSITQFDLTPLSAGTEIRQPQITLNPAYNPFSSPKPSNNTGFSGSNNVIHNRHWEDIMQIQKEFHAPLQEEIPLVEGASHQNARMENQGGHFIQISLKYIATQTRTGLTLIDQQRAHQRILFEKFLENISSQEPLVQTLMFPEQVQLSPSDFSLIVEIQPLLQSAGMMVENFGNKTIVINGVPADTEEMNPGQFIESLLEEIKSEKRDEKMSSQEKIAWALAKTSCIKRGQKLTKIEMEHLIHALFSCTMPHITPKGKSVLVTFTPEEIFKKFN